MKIAESKIAAFGGVVLAAAVVVLTFDIRPLWWMFIDVFFMFMMAFTWFVSVLLAKYNVRAQKKLQQIATVCGVLWILSLIGEYIALCFRSF